MNVLKSSLIREVPKVTHLTKFQGRAINRFGKSFCS
jgi:hypothetical protein